MAYNLPMQINLQAPPASNISAIKKSIEAGIGNIKVADIGTASFAKANAQIKNLTKTFDIGEASARSFFETVEGKARSYAAYAVASTAVLKLSGVVAQATREAIKYEKELIGIAQTTDESVKATRSQSKALEEISVKYNITLSKVAQLTRIIAQTGMSFKESAKAAELLAKTSLLASFDNLQDTTEGLIAIMQSFNMTATQSAGILEKVNIVSKKFAVESGDIVEAIRRAGGAFKAAGGQIEELIALFTSVRSTTRESADTIATGFRTIFARLERPKTIEYFKQLGIQLEDSAGQFIGPLRAIEEISAGLQKLGIRAGSIKFAEVVEEIGGIRQLSRVIPLLEQLGKTQEALKLQNESAGESFKDLEKAQQGLGYRLGALGKEFTVFISDVVNSSSFKFLADIFIGISKTVLTLTNALKPLLPILSVLAAYKIGKGLQDLLSGKLNFSNLAIPVKIAGETQKMAAGGLVPGSGNRDTVPAMLTPGEFVIRKSAVNAIGANRLASINKYKKGGPVRADAMAAVGGISDQFKKSIYKTADGPFKKGFAFNPDDELTAELNYKSISIAEQLKKYTGENKAELTEKLKQGNNAERGNAFEELLASTMGLDRSTSARYPVDFINKPFGEAKFIEKKLPEEIFIDKLLRAQTATGNFKAKNTSAGGELLKLGLLNIYTGDPKEKFAKGGAVGTDTVPAMLTPGEFVVNKKSAQAYGYANLKKINKYKNGGMVGSAQGNINTDLERGTGNLIYTIDELEKEINNIVNGLGTAGDKIKQMNLQIAVAAPKQMEREDGRITRGSFDPRGKAPVITTAAGVATQSTAAHEVGHAVDYSMGSGGKYASEQEGTLQNTLAKLAKDQIAAALRAKGVSEKDIEYRTKLRELFADFFQKSEPDVRAVLASTSDFAEGMHLLAKTSSVTSRLYGDIQKNLKIAFEESGKITMQVSSPFTPKTGAAPTATSAATPAPPSEPPDSMFGKFMSKLMGMFSKKTIEKEAKKEKEPEPFTKKKLKEELKTGGRGAIEEEIKGKAQQLKALQESQKQAEEAYLQNKANLEKIDNELVKGITGHKAYNKAIQAKVKLEQQVAASETEYKAITEKVTSTRKEKEGLQAKSKAMGQAAKETLKTGTQGSFAKFDEEATKITKSVAAANKGFELIPAKLGQFTIWANTAASALKNFGGININEDVLRQGTARADVLGGASYALGKIDAGKINQITSNIGKASGMISKFGGQIGGKFGGAISSVGTKLGTFGTKFAAYGPKIISGAQTLAKGLNIASWVEIFGTFADAIFSVDYGKLKDQAIAMGDVQNAGINAASQYNQEFFRGIPLIGGFLASLQELIPFSDQAVTSMAKLVVATAEGAAFITKAGRDLETSRKTFQEGLLRGDQGKVQSGLQESQATIKELRDRAIDITSRADRERKGGAANLVASTVGGMAGGAAAGGTAGSVIPAIGTAIGATVMGTVGGIYGFIKTWTSSTKHLGEAYDTAGKLYEEYGNQFAEQVKMVGDAMASTAVQVIKNGGSVEEAFGEIKKKFGEEAFSQMFGGADASIEGLQEAYKNADKISQDVQKEIEAKRKAIGEAEKAVASSWFKGGAMTNKKKLESELKELEAKKRVADQTKDTVTAMQTQINKEEALAKQRAIEIEAMRKQIELSRGLVKAFDNVNSTMRKFADIEDEISKIGTGQLTRKQAIEKSGIGGMGISADTLAMSTEEIMRNPKAMSEMTAGASRFGAVQGMGSDISNMMKDTQKNLDILDRAEAAITQGELGTKVSDIRTKAQTMSAEDAGKAREEAGTIIAKDLAKTLTGQDFGELDTGLQKALQDYGNAIAGGMDPAEATEKIKKEVGGKAAEFIEKQKTLYNELIDKEQKLREYEIQLVNKRAELAQKSYDAEKDYFEKRFNLANKVEDFLEPETTGPGKAAKIAEKAGARKEAKLTAIGERTPANLPSVAEFSARVNEMTKATGDVGTAFAELQGQSNLLLTVINDQISAEEEYLNGLMDSAKAQQAYTQALYDAQGKIVETLVFGTDQEKADTLKAMNATVQAAQQGSLQGIPESQRKDVMSMLDQFGDVKIPGLGKEGKLIKRDIIKNEMMKQYGVDEATAGQLADKAIQKQVPVEERMGKAIEDQKKVLEGLYAEEHKVKMDQIAMEEDNTNTFAASVENFRTTVQELRDKLGIGEAGQQAENKVKEEEAVQAKKAAQEQTQAAVPTYGLNEDQQAVARQLAGAEDIISREKYMVSAEERKQLAGAKERKAKYEEQLSGVSRQDVELYQQAYRNSQVAAANTTQTQASVAVAPAAQAAPMPTVPAADGMAVSGAAPPRSRDPVRDAIRRQRAEAAARASSNAPQASAAPAPMAPTTPATPAPIVPAAPATPVTTGQQAANGGVPIQVQSQGQQEITVRLPDIQALVNQAITATVFETVAETFTNIANDVRAASNFDDVANAFMNGMERSVNKETGGQG